LGIEVVTEDDVSIGTSLIDLEEYYFNREYRSTVNKPVETRSIVHPTDGAKGLLELFIEIIPASSSQKRVEIKPQIPEDFEVQAVIWETKDCVYKDVVSKSNDMYVTGGILADVQTTDTHWFCRDVGSFNWRMKMPITLPLNTDKNYAINIFKVTQFLV
jgi:hypothetical protein